MDISLTYLASSNFVFLLWRTLLFSHSAINFSITSYQLINFSSVMIFILGGRGIGNRLQSFEASQIVFQFESTHFSALITIRLFILALFLVNFGNINLIIFLYYVV